MGSITSWLSDKAPAAFLASGVILLVGAKLNGLGVAVLPKFTSFCVNACPLFFTGFIIASTSIMACTITLVVDEDGILSAVVGVAVAVEMLFSLSVKPALSKEFIGIVGAMIFTCVAFASAVDYTVTTATDHEDTQSSRYVNY
jgi:hypothetical protein